MEMHEFTSADWMGFAGASRGPNGEEPLIGELEVSFTMGDGDPAELRGKTAPAVLIASYPEHGPDCEVIDCPESGGLERSLHHDAALELSVDGGAATYVMRGSFTSCRAVALLLPAKISSKGLTDLGFEIC